jgi:hypothetical protein
MSIRVGTTRTRTSHLARVVLVRLRLVFLISFTVMPEHQSSKTEEENKKCVTRVGDSSPPGSLPARLIVASLPWWPGITEEM